MALRSLLGIALVSGCIALTSTFGSRALASDPDVVALGEVSSSVKRGDLDLPSFLRSTFEEELHALDLGRAPLRGRAILSVSLVRMDTLASQGSGPVTTCVVSATLRDAKRGSVFAILEGKAHGASDAGARAIVRTAVQGAVARIPEAMRR